jgi:hypothetical protein
LTVEEARERLLEAAERANPREWIRKNPLEALAAAFMAGLGAGGCKKSTCASFEGYADILFRMLNE